MHGDPPEPRDTKSKVARELRLLLGLSEDEPILAGPPATGAGGCRQEDMPTQLAVPSDLALENDPSWPRIAGYTIRRVLGQGGMGVVYEAIQESVGRRVALKVMNAPAGGKGAMLDRFRREVQSMGRIDHPLVVPILDSGAQGDVAYYSMKYVDGEPLSAIVERGSLEPMRVARLVRDVAGALAAVHAAGVLHRDVKSSNILVARTASGERALLTDFGLAWMDSGPSLTASGWMLGTPAYMSPEQAEGRAHALDARSDIYSLGVVLYEALTGSVPFVAAHVHALIMKIHDERPVPPRKLLPDLDPDLEAVVATCLEKEPGLRYATAEALATALDRVLAKEAEGEAKPDVAAPLSPPSTVAAPPRSHAGSGSTRVILPGARKPRLATSLVLATAAFLAATALGVWRVHAPFDLAYFDWLHRRRPESSLDSRIAVVYVGDSDIARFEEKLGKWPWASRVPHATVVRLLGARGAERIGFDILFTEPSSDSEGDLDLVQAIVEGPPVVHGFYFRTGPGAPPESRTSELGMAALAASGGHFGAADRSGFPHGTSPELPIDPLLEASARLGHVNAIPDADGVLRRVPLFFRYEDRLVPSLALRLALDHLGAAPDQVVVEPGRHVRITAGDGREISIPIDLDGSMLVRFEHPPEDFRGYQYDQIEDAAPDAFQARIVLVGLIASGHIDRVATPLSPADSGLLVHAQVLENILTGRFLAPWDPYAAPVTPGKVAVIVLVLAACLGLAVAASRFPMAVAALAAVLAAGIPWALSAWLFLAQDIWYPPAATCAALSLAAVAVMSQRAFALSRERLRLRLVYERYLSPRVLGEIVKSPRLLAIGGRRVEVTVVHVRVRDFEAFSEAAEPEELIRTLNEYYAAMIELIDLEEGTIDRLAGGAIRVFFGDPTPQPDHALRGVRLAVSLSQRMQALQRTWTLADRETFNIGVGVHTGHATVGNFGSERFTEYAAVGPTVHVAEQTAEGTLTNQVRITVKTYREVLGAVEAHEVGIVRVRGGSDALKVYEIAALTGRQGPVLQEG